MLRGVAGQGSFADREAKVEGRREKIKMGRERREYIFGDDWLCNWDWEEDLEGVYKDFFCLPFIYDALNREDR